MIDNVVLLMNGALQKKAVKDMLGKCHPLGLFTEMEAVNIAETAADLFQAVLVETPLGTRPGQEGAAEPGPLIPQAGTGEPPARASGNRLG